MAKRDLVGDVDFSGVNLQRLYDSLAKILGKKYNANIKFTVTRKDEIQTETETE